MAATTAIFIWASFNHYFLEKFGAGIAAVMSIVAIIVMFFLIDKGLGAIIEFLADEKINPGSPSSDENPKARRTFMRTVMFLALIRLLATGTTSIWGSYEIADYITEAPDKPLQLERWRNIIAPSFYILGKAIRFTYLFSLYEENFLLPSCWYFFDGDSWAFCICS